MEMQVIIFISITNNRSGVNRVIQLIVPTKTMLYSRQYLQGHFITNVNPERDRKTEIPDRSLHHCTFLRAYEQRSSGLLRGRAQADSTFWDYLKKVPSYNGHLKRNPIVIPSCSYRVLPIAPKLQLSQLIF